MSRHFIRGMSKVVVGAILLAGLGASQGKVKRRGATRRFVSQKYRFSMAVPAGWGVSTQLDTPVFFFARRSSDRFIQDNIPKGGAVITTTAQDIRGGARKSATTPEAWALIEARAVASKTPKVERFEVSEESGVSRAVVCSSDEATFSPEQRPQHSVAIYWEFEQKLFAAHLNYNAGDPDGPRLEKIFFQAVRSIRPIDKH